MARKSTIDTSDLLPISIRLPKDLKDWIEATASHERRSINSQVVLLLQEIKGIKVSESITTGEQVKVEVQPPDKQ